MQCADDGDCENVDYQVDVADGISVSTEGNLPPGLVTPGGPFSALVPSMVPQEILQKFNESKDTEDPNEQPEYRWVGAAFCQLFFELLHILVWVVVQVR